MEPSHAYTVGLTVQNPGIINWSSKNGIILRFSSANGFMFDPDNVSFIKILNMCSFWRFVQKNLRTYMRSRSKYITDFAPL